MGMYNEIKVNYSCLDKYHKAGDIYQTKSIEPLVLNQYTLTKEGKLKLENKYIKYDGILCFYKCNAGAVGSKGYYTYDSKPFLFRQWVFLFNKGKIIDKKVTYYRRKGKHFKTLKEWMEAHV